MPRRDFGTQVGLIGFIRPTTMLRLAHRVPTVAPRHARRLAGIAAGSLASVPLRLGETLGHGRRIRETAIPEAPVFIIGHWRSGTTHLHNLMSMDPALGSLRMFQTLAPDCSLATRTWLPDLLQRVMPTQRPMDEMEWPMDAPQEEEIALAKMTPYSWYLSFLFPRHAVQSFDRFVLLQGARPGVHREVARKLLHVYRVATLHEGGRRLLLKNPVNTCRIPMLRSLFPDARFVFLHRSPYEVYSSTIHLHRKILELTALQEIDETQLERNVVDLHRRVTSTYLRDRSCIPSDRLVEIGYEDLSREPLRVLEEVYDSLGLPGFDALRPAASAYLEGQRGYRKNRFSLSDRARELVEEAWEEDFRAFGYEKGPAAA